MQNQENEEEKMDFFYYHVPLIYQGAYLGTCDKVPREHLLWAKKWIKNPSSAYITGKLGTGKTYFAFALIKEFVFKHDRGPIFRVSCELDTDLLIACTSKETDKPMIKVFSECELLFIDDFGNETGSDRLKIQYFQIINNRYTEKLPTIVTSNLDLDQLAKAVGGRIASRMQTWDCLEFEGEDLRAEE